MKLRLNGAEIYDKISLCYCVTDAYASGRSDSMVLRFNDPHGLWTTWAPETGDEIAFENGDFKTGRMFIHAVRPENGLYTIRAYSVPAGAKLRRSKSWQGVHFLQIAGEAAARAGLRLDIHGAADRLYGYMQQTNRTDLNYLSELCTLEGYGMLVYDGRLVIYDELQLERQPSGRSVRIGADGVYTFEDRSAAAYDGATVYSGAFTGSFMISGKMHDKILFPETAITATSNAEATRYARGLLRQANKALVGGSFRQELHPEISAGSVINLQVLKASKWNGKYFVTHVRHDHVKNSSTVTVRRTLEDY